MAGPGFSGWMEINHHAQCANLSQLPAEGQAELCEHIRVNHPELYGELAQYFQRDAVISWREDGNEHGDEHADHPDGPHTVRRCLP
jgi:hypothetical protein